MRYQFRFAFDAGSGVCLWSHNDAAVEEYDVAVDHHQLPLSENTKKWLDYLIVWYDTSLDWEDPGRKDEVWTAAEQARFYAAVDKGLELLEKELPNGEYEILDLS